MTDRRDALLRDLARKLDRITAERVDPDVLEDIRSSQASTQRTLAGIETKTQELQQDLTELRTKVDTVESLLWRGGADVPAIVHTVRALNASKTARVSDLWKLLWAVLAGLLIAFGAWAAAALWRHP